MLTHRLRPRLEGLCKLNRLHRRLLFTFRLHIFDTLELTYHRHVRPPPSAMRPPGLQYDWQDGPDGIPGSVLSNRADHFYHPGAAIDTTKRHTCL